MYYPVKSVVTYNKYLNKEGNDVLAVPRRGDVKEADGSRGRSRLMSKPKAQTRNRERRLKFR